MIKKSFETVGIGVDYLHRKKIYWYRLQSLQQEIDRSPLPNINYITRSIFVQQDAPMDLQPILPPFRAE